MVDELSDADLRWNLTTPEAGWAVSDQISHLAYFDDAGRMAMVDPDAFALSVESVLASTGDPMDVNLGRGRAMGGDELPSWRDGAHRAMLDAGDYPGESGCPTCRLDEAAGRMSPWQSQEGNSPSSTRPRQRIESSARTEPFGRSPDGVLAKVACALNHAYTGTPPSFSAT